MTPNSSLLQWLSTFQLNGVQAVELKNDAYYHLADGYVCAKILNQISPQYFSNKWLDGIKPVAPNGSWCLRVSNLNRILQKIHDYASDLQSSQFMLGTINPDVTVIAQNFDPDQISRLIQLILFCAINCDQKQDYIEKIRDLPTQVKQDIKEAIEELLVKNNNQNQPDKFMSRQVGNESNTSDTGDPKNRLDTSSTSSHTTSPPYRNINHRPSHRKDSSSSDTNKRNDSSNLDISSQSYQSETTNFASDVKSKLYEALRIKDEKAQACYELELKLRQLQLERDQLAQENEKLSAERINNASVSANLRRSSNTSREYEMPNHSTNSETIARSKLFEETQKSQDMMLSQNRRLQNELQRLKEELIKVETEKEDHRLRSNLLKEDLDKITMKHEDLRTRAEQAKRLQDELDEHKQMTEKVINYEAAVENLVKKNNELKKELKSLEDKNLAHVQNAVLLEQEVQQLKISIDQVEIYRRQLNDAQVKLSQETHRADQAEVELARLLDKFEAAKRENEKLFEATNQLIRNSTGTNKDKQQDEIYEQNKTFESVNLKGRIESVRIIDENVVINDVSNNSNQVSELKERIARLEMENQLLKTKVDTKVESNKSVLNRLLDETTEKCKQLEGENRQVRKKMLMLESNLRDLSQLGQPSTSSALIQDSSSDNVLALIKRVEDLQRLLYQRDQDLREAETRYKKNIQKAKDVIKALNNNQSINNSLQQSCMSSASFNSGSLDEINVLKQQLQDREDRLIKLERDFFEFKKLKEFHERLILSAFYGLTTPMQWKNAEKRLERTTLTSPSGANNTHVSKMNHLS